VLAPIRVCRVITTKHVNNSSDDLLGAAVETADCRAAGAAEGLIVVRGMMIENNKSC